MRTPLHRSSLALALLLPLAFAPACAVEDDEGASSGTSSDTGTDGTDGTSDTAGGGTSTSGGATTGAGSSATSDASATSTSGGTGGSEGTTGAGSASSTSGPTTGATSAGGTSSSSGPGTTSMGGSDSDSDSTTGPSPMCEGDGAPISGAVAAIARRLADVPPPGGGGTGGSSSSTGGDPPDGDTLLVQIADHTITCANPTPDTSCTDAWRLSFRLAPDEQLVGTVMNVDLGFSETLAGTGPDCGAGGGGGDLVTIEITAIDDEVIEGRICGSTFGYDGTFRATRC